MATAWPGRLQQRGVVGGRLPAAARWAASSRGKAEGLRRLGAEQAVARHRRLDHAALDALQGVGDRDGGNRARRASPAPCQQGRDRARRDQRPRRVVHQHDVGRMRRQRLQAGAHAVLACGAAGDRRQVSQPGERRVDRRRLADRLQQGAPGGPATPRRGGSPACRRAAGTASASPRRTGCRSRPRPGWRQSSHGGDRCRSHATIAAVKHICSVSHCASAGVSHNLPK